MQKTVAAKLIPSHEQAKALKSTLAVFADACNQALKVAKANNLKRAFDIHKLCYYEIKNATGLTSNYVVRAKRKRLFTFTLRLKFLRRLRVTPMMRSALTWASIALPLFRPGKQFPAET